MTYSKITNFMLLNLCIPTYFFLNFNFLDGYMTICRLFWCPYYYYSTHDPYDYIYMYTYNTHMLHCYTLLYVYTTYIIIIMFHGPMVPRTNIFLKTWRINNKIYQLDNIIIVHNQIDIQIYYVASCSPKGRYVVCGLYI